MARLRYTGEIVTTFSEAGEVLPGAVFEVPDSEAERYTRRSDVYDIDAPAEPAENASPAVEHESAPEAAEVTPQAPQASAETAA